MSSSFANRWLFCYNCQNSGGWISFLFRCHSTMFLHAHISAGGWTIGSFVAAVQRRTLLHQHDRHKCCKTLPSVPKISEQPLNNQNYLAHAFCVPRQYPSPLVDRPHIIWRRVQTIWRRLGGPQSRCGHRGYRKNPFTSAWNRTPPTFCPVCSQTLYCLSYSAPIYRPTYVYSLK
jgi:hypothetical protein